MAAPPYTQAMLDPRPHFGRGYGLGTDSEGEMSSIADISTTMADSDTDGEALLPQTRTMRGLVDSFKSKLHIRPNGSHATNAPGGHTLRETRSVVSPVSSNPSRNGSVSDVDFAGSDLSRAESIYTLSRVSFASRLAQLTSIPLPSASALSARITSQPTAHLAARSLTEAGEQIKIWTRKASDVLQDLDAQDDVEWSAAGGRDGVEEVGRAITKFEGLVKVYVISMEELQTRSDISTLSDETLKTHVVQMDGVITEWQKIKHSLKDVKEQVECALEWEELWNTVLGEAAQELAALNDLIFEMEEKRHEITATVETSKRDSTIDLDDLTSPTKASKKRSPPRASLGFSPGQRLDVPAADGSRDDARLLGLFARMQPLRAGLDFLPMRLANFRERARDMFPSGCAELDTRRDTLEEQWTKLEADANALRKELGEDRWLLVFRNAATQALQMFDSVGRTIQKLLNHYVASPHADQRAIKRLHDSYEAKKTHYLPAIERVLGLIDQGMKDRLSLNGEILRLQVELKRRYRELQERISDADHIIANGGLDNSNHQLRDSVSTILSSEISHSSSAIDSAHSSPASSVMLWSRSGSTAGPSTPSVSSSRLPKQRRSSNLAPSTPSARPRLSDAKRLVTAPSLPTFEPYQDKKLHSFRDFKQPLNKPRWSSSGHVSTQQDFPPLSISESAQSSLATSNATPSPRKYVPSRASSSYFSTPTTADRRAASPAPSLLASPSTARKLSYSTLPPRSASAMDHRSVSSPSKLRQSLSTISRSTAPATPSTVRKGSSNTASTLLALVDEEGPGTPTNTTHPPSSIPRLGARRISNLGTAAASSSSIPVTTTSGRRSSLAGMLSTPSRKTSGLVVPSRTGHGRDSRIGIRSASVMSMARDDERTDQPRWKF